MTNTLEYIERIKRSISENSLPNELWKEFKLSDTSKIIWHISNMGRVAKGAHIIYGKKHNNGYLYLGNMTAIHRLVAMYFIPKSEDDIRKKRLFVDHINGDTEDNRAINLRWCTIKENNSFPLARKHNSDSHKGCKNPNFGVSPKSKGKVLYNNGVVAHYYAVGKQPDGWYKGRIK